MPLSDRDYMKMRRARSRMSVLVPWLARLMWIALGILLTFLFMIWQPKISGNVLHSLAALLHR